MGEVPKVPWFPAAATAITLREAAWSSACCNSRSPLEEGCASAALKLSTRAPDLTQSPMASANSSGVALGMSPFAELVSEKMGRTMRVQPGQMAGAVEPLRAASMPATKVP